MCFSAHYSYFRDKNFKGNMAEETKNTQTELQPLAEEQSFFSLESIFRMLVLNWQWFVLSLIVALGIAFLYLRYTTPVYNTYAKILVKGS